MDIWSNLMFMKRKPRQPIINQIGFSDFPKAVVKLIAHKRFNASFNALTLNTICKT